MGTNSWQLCAQDGGGMLPVSPALVAVGVGSADRRQGKGGGSLCWDTQTQAPAPIQSLSNRSSVSPAVRSSRGSDEMQLQSAGKEPFFLLVSLKDQISCLLKSFNVKASRA